MITKRFSIEIQASAEKVWYALWDSVYYTKWASLFNESATFLCDWEEGEKVFFSSKGGNGKVSTLEKVRLYKKAIFIHQCEMINYEEFEEDNWTGLREQYDIKEKDGVTALNLLLDFPEANERVLSKIYPKALLIIKEIAENLKIVVEITVKASLMVAWRLWCTPEHIKNWNVSTNLWHVLSAENEVYIGGKFCYQIETKDGYLRHKYEGEYTNVLNLQLLEFKFTDGRIGKVSFIQTNIGVRITEVFDPKHDTNVFMQKSDRLLAMYSFQKYVDKFQQI